VAIVPARTARPGIVGFAAMGLGIATGVPLAIVAVGRIGRDADSAVAGITTVTYSAGLPTGPCVGALGSAVSLSFAFGIVALLSVGIVVSAYTLRVGLGDQAVMPE